MYVATESNVKGDLTARSSWKSTFVGLSQRPQGFDDEALKKHLQDAQTIELLTRPFSPYTVPTIKSKAIFETKTSAINVSPGAHGRCNIKEIRDDTVWLSKATSLDEVAALRITVLEWQTRPANRLLFSDAYDDKRNGINTVVGNGLRSSVSGLNSTLVTGNTNPKEEDLKTFEEAGSRHQRLLQIYLSERRYLIRVCEFIIFVALFDAFPQPSDDERDKSTGKSPDTPGWLAEVGNEILIAWNLDGLVQTGDQHFSVKAIDALHMRFRNLESGSDWLDDEPFREEIDRLWAKDRLLEIIHIMQLLLILLVSSTKLTRADTVLAWFRLMKEYGFLENFQSVGEPQRSRCRD